MDTEQAEFSPEPHKRVGRDTRELEFSPEAPRQIERDEVEMQEEMQEEMQDEIHDGAVHHESEIRHEQDLEQDADGHIHHKGILDILLYIYKIMMKGFIYLIKILEDTRYNVAI